ncbi:MAG: hypothetical protein R3D27_04975 [Hyphomicrobiaceae bacterium]
MQLDWEGLFRRYVFDPEKTPYFTPVGRLTKSQAGNEIFVFSLFVGIFFVVLGVAALAGRLPDKDALIVPVFAFFTAWTAVAFWWTRSQMAAAFAALGPLAVLLYCLVYGFAQGLGLWDKVLIVVVLIAWLHYSWRIVRLAAAWPTMPPGAPPRRGRRNPFI